MTGRRQRPVAYDVALGRVSRDLRRLPAAIGRAHKRGDARAVDYLSRRLLRAQEAARALGLYDAPRDPFDLRAVP